MKRTPLLLAIAIAASVTTMGRPAVAAGDAETRSMEAAPADDTARNVRDQGGETPTADTQSHDPADLEVTRRIREAIVKNDRLSTSAHNVKIITNAGIVTLRGPVVSEEERATVAATALHIDGVKRIDNQLEIARR